MFSDLDYKYTAKVSADSWFVKFFCWMWWAEPESLDFCKLFWGYLFAIPNLLLRLILSPVYFLVIVPLRKAIERAEKSDPVSIDVEMRRRRERMKQKKEREERVNSFFTSVSAFFSRKPVRIAMLAFLGIIGIVLLALLGYVAYLFVLLLLDNWAQTLLFLGMILGVIIVGFSIALLAVFFTETAMGRSIAFTVKNGKSTFFGAIRTGFIGLKTNTCPKIELVDSKK